jgi:site-specific DNA recombinase
MINTNGRDPKKAILYARVSTEEQARSGYSLAQQMEALREHAAQEGYEVLEEVTDPGQSGASLERPGMDRVRNLVAASGAFVVLAQDRDRFSREPAYTYLLKREFEEHGCKIRALNDQGDDSPEGELMDGVFDQFAKFERAKTAERTRKGKLQKARKGKLVRNARAHYGFEYDETGERYLLNEEEMAVVRRIFRLVSSGSSLYGVKRSLELDDVPPPGNGHKAGGRFWYTNFLQTVVKDDVYKPHACDEIAGLVDEGLLAEEVAASLDESSSYGIFWFNRTRTTRKRVTKVSSTGKEYRWQRKTYQKPRDQWIAIPVPDADIPREVVKAAREIVRYKSPAPRKGRRFWEIPSGVVRCGGCGNAMLRYSATVAGHVYSYYKCRRLVRDSKDACSPERLRTNHRAEEVEQKVWSNISDLMKDPEQLRGDIDRMIELEKNGSYGNPEQEEKAWLGKLAEANRMRRGYQEQAAKGYMTFDELGAALSDLEETRKSVERELQTIRNRLERVEQLQQDKDVLREDYFGIAPDALDSLTPEERHNLYKLVRLRVVIYPNCDLEISWVGGEGLLFSTSETVLQIDRV